MAHRLATRERRTRTFEGGCSAEVTALAALLAIVLLGFAAGCARVGPVREVPPYETLLMILADFRRCADTDLYHYEIPKDISGQNIFRATLERLAYFEQANPGKDGDAVNFARGEAYFRLGDFARAGEAFSRVAAVSNSPLAEKAKERAETTARFRAATQRAPATDQLGPYLRDLELQQKRLEDLEKEFAGRTEETLARRERERVETEYALALFRNRYVLDKGAARALDFLRGMIERHAQSRRLHAHRLMLGRFYFELAQDLVTLAPPDRLGFDMDLFYDLVNNAEEQFVVVSRADGYPEKLEAAGLLRELEAFTRRVRALADNPLPKETGK